MELWNKNDISMPPTNSVIMKNRDIDITHLKFILNGALKAMEHEHLLHREAAVLSRLIFKLQRPLRGQKGLMCIYKVNRGLKRYLSLDLQYVYSNFSKILSCVEDINDCVYVPTKQMLQYLLVRTQGFCKIMNYLSIACEDAAHYFKGILQIGHLINLCLFSLSVVSRIWFCARYLIICACQWYDQLLPYLEKLKIKGPCWLPTEYTFPENLGSWLGSNPITGDLKCDVDIQKISEELSLIKNFKDLGTLVNREDFIARKNEGAGSLGESVKVCFLNQKGKLSTDLNVELMVNNNNFSSETGNKPVENSVDDFSDLLVQDVKIKSVHATINASNSMSLQNDFGEQISRDLFHAQKTKKKSFSSTTNKDNGIPEKLCRDNQKLLMGTVRKDGGETRTFINGEISERKRRTQLRKELHTPLKVKSSMSSTKSGENIAFAGRQTNVANLSPKTLSDAFCSSGTSQVVEKKLVSKDINDLKVFDVNRKKTSVDTTFKRMQMENEFVHSIQSSTTLNDNKDIGSNFEFKSNAEHISDVSEGQEECAINSGFKKKKNNSLGNWEIIHEIRTLKDAKAFLLSEKKARKQGKGCVTSQLNNSEWVVLFESINKHLKKNNVSKLKGNRLKHVIEEIRNTLIAFVI
ncbi:hypothetical protein R5R35_007643 [Gryllus longicercus]|uniref:Nucleolus and neural progenitor protein-like N-terminal domain-containing protein n=1 Tax=Gryllus longicercus TaxID=2509291 RepID=A0AAN9VLJ2_9ORTH